MMTVLFSEGSVSLSYQLCVPPDYTLEFQLQSAQTEEAETRPTPTPQLPPHAPLVEHKTE